MVITVTITPGVSPMDRGTLEDMVADALGEGVEFLGGGTLMGDPPISDFSLAYAGPHSQAEARRLCEDVLRGVDFALPTDVTVEVEPD